MQRKVFKNIDEVIQYLENQLIVAQLKDLHNQQLDYIEEAVLKSDLKEANEVIKHIMEK